MTSHENKEITACDEFSGSLPHDLLLVNQTENFLTKCRFGLRKTVRVLNLQFKLVACAKM